MLRQPELFLQRVPPTKKAPLCRIFNEDCYEGLKKLPENSVDLIATDPPYFLDGMGDDWSDDNLKRKASRSNTIGGYLSV
jgi:DNA modification methylase